MIATLVSPELEQQAIAWRRHLHANPELSFEERETSQFVHDRLTEIEGLELDRPTATSVVARLAGARPGPTIALRADIDALPISEETGLDFASTRPGVMHACGHDGHTAMLLSVARLLTERRADLAGEVRLIFQHAEEKPPGGAVQLIEAGVLEGVDLIVGAHLFSDLETGKICAPVGPFMAAADVLSIEILGSGGHAAFPHETVDPIAVAAQVISNLQQIVSRETKPLDSAVVSITRIEGGTTDNVIPESVRLGGTARALSEDVRERTRAAIERVVKGVTEAHRAGYRFEYTDGYPPVVNEADAVARVTAAAEAELGDVVVEQEPIMGGEDFASYLKVAPGAFFGVGAGGKGAYPHHHPRFVIDEAGMRAGIAVLTRVALDFLGV